MPKGVPKKIPATKTATKKVTAKAIKKATPEDEKKKSAPSTPKVLSRKTSVELKRSESLKT